MTFYNNHVYPKSRINNKLLLSWMYSLSSVIKAYSYSNSQL